LDQRRETAGIANNPGAVGESPGNRRREEREETAMQNARVSTSPSLTRTIIVGGSAALAAAVLFAGLVVAPRSATALPAYAQKEGKACGYCHSNPAGGGERNAKGKAYEAGGHSFKK
jgi:hypothetical protein